MRKTELSIDIVHTRHCAGKYVIPMFFAGSFFGVIAVNATSRTMRFALMFALLAALSALCSIKEIKKDTHIICNSHWSRAVVSRFSLLDFGDLWWLIFLPEWFVSSCFFSPLHGHKLL